MLSIRNIVPAAVGELIMLGLASIYDAVVDDPKVRAAARAEALAEARARTEAAINEVHDDAEKARAMRRHCSDIGRVYDFATGECGEERP